ncbi:MULTISPECIES: chaplin [unclassified Streptomyces]|uniref:chaplin n=1 Tax=unclassified Streptomyces TaxID=2593676 RepID=UPI001369127E|nr:MULTISPECIES: chaplin [unclassified Streptomyces]MCW5251024.1 chaplin [Streptomyces sp. SHP 1-2]MYU22793.1 DUF320 domain-containing protein [Streptomyces sp. SID8352]
MRQATRKGLMTVAAATGVIAAASGAAHADSGAHGASAGSPGVVSGNTVQAPVHVPVNVCGNTVDAVGALNPAMGNSCVNRGDGGAHAEGHASDSPGVGSGNNVQVPVDVPVNVCGNSVNVVGLLNPALGNNCENGGGHEAPPVEPEPEKPVTPSTPGTETPPAPGTPERPAPGPQGPVNLAETGNGIPLGLSVPLGAGVLLTGVVLYRRARAGV